MLNRVRGTYRVLRGFCLFTTIGAMSLMPGVPEANTRTVPVSFVADVVDLSEVDEVVMPHVNVSAFRAEDASKATVGRGVPFRVALPARTHVTVPSAGTIEQLDDGARLWRIRFTSRGARFLSFAFSDFRLPRGAELYFYSVDRDFQVGPYTARHNNPLGVFASPAIPGDSAVIELFVPARVRAWPHFVIEHVSHGYREFPGFAAIPLRPGARREARTAPIEKAVTCLVNVVCPEGVGWQSERDAVAMIYDGSGYLCSGTLIANARQDCTNYLLTANHCVDKKRTAAMLTFYWNVESPECLTAYPVPGDHITVGSTLRATSRDSDFTLLELNEAPDPAYHVYYAGFNRSAEPPSAGTCIGHPYGWAKKISHEYDPLVEGNDPRAGMGDTHWLVTAWDVGTTTPGSSGSALWNPGHEIVGQLTGGNGECGGWSGFGKLSVSWANGLSEYLDPNGTGVAAVAGHYATSACYGGCSADPECDDASECTADTCNAGACENWPVPDTTVCTEGICCEGVCRQLICTIETVEIDCPERSCKEATCIDDGSCSAACQYTDLPEGTSCATDRECCAGMCMLRECVGDADCQPDGDVCTRDECVSSWADGCEARSCHYTFDPTLDPSCEPCVPTHDKEKGPRCSDGIDNDCDGMIDGADPDC